MKTRANIKGHAIHQMLVPFPIAFLTGAMVSDCIGRMMNFNDLFATAAYLSVAGICTAVVAAAPGMIDYFGAVPPRSSAKKRATYHMALNLTAIALFACAFALRGPVHEAPAMIVLLIEIVAVGLMTVGGWLGGTLVNRNFMGPEHRYANKGKWKEESFTANPGEQIVVAKIDDLQDDHMKLLRVNDRRIVLARTDGKYVAFDDRCAHRGASLADGVLICGKVQCLWHGSRFDVHTGKVECGPAETGIDTYEVTEADGQVRLKVP